MNQSNCIRQIGRILQFEHGTFIPECGGDFHYQECAPCAQFHECRRGMVLSTMVNELTKEIDS